ncbi:MAG: GNAT family N-acetyltransferase [Chloroflexi bacterium]|uniref:GNAT family N-acetyltransferase n=1 Tax=Candidatus Chlorohelix allophototropha TaxID=3003348 RepID=A0A8T7M3T3_9CHLR|nr:GNAT family N-acetyltransferase [Chloroflexota bacterium]WJW66111.1 GNAT family N-acetyltransferase [Chloroflexota bacterium L227-S17]
MVAAISSNKLFENTARAKNGQQTLTWTVTSATADDRAEIKALFWKLHAFNSALDHRFALSEEWESCFETHLAEIVEGNKAICWLARDKESGKACGMLIAAIHRDSVLWRCREWAEVEALFIENQWRGSGMAEALLETAGEWALEKGQTVVQLYVTASNQRAISFYRREGFVQTQSIMRKVLD